MRPTQSRAKVRNPWGVLGLSLITLGIYVPFWWYFINREMRDLGRAREVRDLGDSPGLSVLAITLGGILVIPPLWTLVTTCRRIQRADREMGRDDGLNGWIALLIYVVTLGILIHVYMQYQLNKAWQSDAMEALQGTLDAPRLGEAQNADLDRIERLSKLRAEGAITDEQFEAERAKILGDTSN